MLIRLTCPACGDQGTPLVDDLADLPHCPGCGQQFAVVSQAAALPPASTTDAEILSWLSQPGSIPEAASNSAPDCRSCGYTGPLELDAERERYFCPACRSVCRPAVARPVKTTDCPHCGASFDLCESDRGRTVLCPECKYFLGCLLTVERLPYRLFGARSAREPGLQPNWPRSW